jgi:hypothetical protein
MDMRTRSHFDDPPYKKNVNRVSEAHIQQAAITLFLGPRQLRNVIIRDPWDVR